MKTLFLDLILALEGQKNVVKLGQTPDVNFSLSGKVCLAMGAGVSLYLSRDGVHGESVCSSFFPLLSDPFPREHGFYVGSVPFSRDHIPFLVSVSMSCSTTRKQVSSDGSFLKFRMAIGTGARIHKWSNDVFDYSLSADLLVPALLGGSPSRSEGRPVFPNLGSGSVEFVLPLFCADLVSTSDLLFFESLLLVFWRPKSWVQTFTHREVDIVGTALPKKEGCRGSKIGYTDSTGSKSVDTVAVYVTADADPDAFSIGVAKCPLAVADCIADCRIPHAPTLPTPTLEPMPTFFLFAPSSLIGGMGKEIPLVFDHYLEVTNTTTADAISLEEDIVDTCVGAAPTILFRVQSECSVQRLPLSSSLNIGGGVFPPLRSMGLISAMSPPSRGYGTSFIGFGVRVFGFIGTGGPVLAIDGVAPDFREPYLLKTDMVGTEHCTMTIAAPCEARTPTESAQPTAVDGINLEGRPTRLYGQIHVQSGSPAFGQPRIEIADDNAVCGVLGTAQIGQWEGSHVGIKVKLGGIRSHVLKL